MLELWQLADESGGADEILFQGRQSHDCGTRHPALDADQPNTDFWFCHGIFSAKNCPSTLETDTCATMIVGRALRYVN